MPHNGTSPYQERWNRVRRQRYEREERQRQERAWEHQQQRSDNSRVDDIAALFAKGDQAILDWSAKTADYTGFRAEDWHTDADAVQIVLAALNCMREERDRAISLIQLLVSERKALRLTIANLQRPDTLTQRLYAKVGLHEGCPGFVLQTTRTAYRKALHPDGQPERHRAEAERRFKEAEAVFEEIMRLRSR